MKPLLSCVKASAAFPPCRAATAIRMAISTMSATTATGGVVLRRAVLTTPTTGTCTSATRMSSGTTTIRAACSVFVACRTEGAFTRPPLGSCWAGLFEKVILNVGGSIAFLYEG